MNTTARIESTSKPGRIQLSKETGELVIQAGKGHWIEKREQKVEAKGKGTLPEMRKGFSSSREVTSNNKMCTFQALSRLTGSKKTTIVRRKTQRLTTARKVRTALVA